MKHGRNPHSPEQNSASVSTAHAKRKRFVKPAAAMRVGELLRVRHSLDTPVAARFLSC